ncbi:unnamed protein product [Anisakis simplex]|uniref:Uncharacterized protein n=1 Tax=Anisakis simplex TaxID=6269 RepID=A0A3P6SBV7_ANISI|nr:unnamed protein product [Anisakis simplex]
MTVSDFQLTNEIGYDGHATFSRDGSKIVFEASRPKTDAELERYTKMLSYNLVSPKELELFVMNADGSNVTQLTHLGGANISPYFLKDGKRVIFASNHAMDRKCCDFALYLIDLDGKNLEKVTGQNGSADGFPTFDGNQRRMIWASRRNGTHQGETNIFIADWID